MSSLSDNDIERLLRTTPQPVPPASLLAALERDLDTHWPPVEAPGDVDTAEGGGSPYPTRPQPLKRWRPRLWRPLSGLAGIAAAVVCVAVWLSSGAVPAFAAAVKALSRVHSFRVIEHVRMGPSQQVIKDPKIAPNTWPNYSTARHPANPLVEIQHWFQSDPDHPGSGFTHTVGPDYEAWRDGYIELTSSQSGGRTLMLTARSDLFATMPSAAAFITAAQARHDVHQVYPPGVPTGVAVYEHTVRYNDEHVIVRVWITQATSLPQRLQFFSDGFPGYGPTALMQEYEFVDYDASFPTDTFKFHVTDADLESIGVTPEQWDTLDRDAVSMRLTGEAGVEIVGKLHDASGTRTVRGRLPFGCVHVPHGKFTFEFSAVDGNRHSIGIAFNSMTMMTSGKGLRGELSVDRQSSSVTGVD